MDTITLADNVDKKQAYAHLQRVAANFLRDNADLSQKEKNKALYQLLSHEAEAMGIHDYADGISGPDKTDKLFDLQKSTWHARDDFYRDFTAGKIAATKGKYKGMFFSQLPRAVQVLISLRQAKVKRRIKANDKFRKATNLFLRIALSMGRGAFQAVVAMNLNGLASKLYKLRQWNQAKDIIQKWKDIGGNERNFWKVVDMGNKRKKLFLSKKAKDRYIKKFGAINGIGEHDCICAEDSINGPELAAIAAAAVPVIAALVPKIVQAFKNVGTPEAQAEAEDMKAHGEDLASGTSGIPPVQNAMLPGDTQASTPDQNEAMEGIHAGELTQALGQIASTGFDALIGLIKKKKPKWTQTVNKITQAGDDYVTGAYARQSGLKDFAYKAQKFGGVSSNLLLFGGAAALTIFALVGFGRGKK